MSEATLQNYTDAPSVAAPGANAGAASIQSINPQTSNGDVKQGNDIMKAWAAVEEAGQGPDTVSEEEAAAQIDEAAKVAAKPKGAKNVKQEAAPAEAEGETPETGADAESEEEASETEEESAKREAKSDKKLSPKESRELIKQRIALNERMQRKEARLNQQFQQREAQLQQAAARVQPLFKALQAIENGDFDGIAKALGEAAGDASISDWNALNATALQNMQSPVYKQMRKLEAQQRERDAQLAQERQAAAQQKAEAERIAAANEWKKDLAAEVTSDEDPAVAALLEVRPGLVENLFQIQQHKYHTSGEAVSARDAVEELLPAIYEEHQVWSKFFEEHGDSEFLRSLGLQAPAAKVAKPVKVSGQGAILERQTGKKTSGPAREAPAAPKAKPVIKNVSQAQLASPSADKPLTEKQLKERAILAMEQEWRAAAR